MKLKDPYKDSWEQERDKRIANCQHHMFITRCSHCGLILYSEKTKPKKGSKEIKI